MQIITNFVQRICNEIYLTSVSEEFSGSVMKRFKLKWLIYETNREKKWKKKRGQDAVILNTVFVINNSLRRICYASINFCKCTVYVHILETFWNAYIWTTFKFLR